VRSQKRAKAPMRTKKWKSEDDENKESMVQNYEVPRIPMNDPQLDQCYDRMLEQGFKPNALHSAIVE
jgi:hypothetical protein